MTNESRRNRLGSKFNCNKDCEEMNDLKDQWRYFLKSYKSSKRWFIAIMIAIIGMFMSFTIDAYTTSKNSIDKEELHEYVKTEEMISFLLLEMEYVKKIVLLDKAEISDSIINEVFENHRWMLQQFMEYNPRSVSPKPDYGNIMNNYKQRNQ